MSTAALKEIDNFISARVPIIWVTTSEEGRFTEEFAQSIVGPRKLYLATWSLTAGLEYKNQYGSKSKPHKGLENTMAVLKAIQAEPEQKSMSVFILKDFFMGPMEARLLRDMYQELADQGKIIIITSPFLAHMPGGQKEGLPPTLEKQICIVEYGLPSHEEILQRLKRLCTSLDLNYENQEMDEFARALRGLTSLEIDNATCICYKELKKLDTEYLVKFKRQNIKKSQLLEFLETDVDIDDVGGLDKVKDYFDRYKNAFGEEARDFGVEPLKLVILTGVPGVGKSLTCKTIGHIYKLPLLKADIGRLYGSLVGQSESRARQLVEILEGSAPCICMIDELEKGLSGSGSDGRNDSGTSSRVFGTLLTAIQEGLKDVLLVATANDISSIPPEFIRRANEVFFVDLPSPEERWDILRIHLEKRGRRFEKYEDMKSDFLAASDTFTGAEIEKVVKDAIARAFYDESKDVTPKHILEAISETKPIAQVMETEIKALQEWAKGHARYASSYSERESTPVSEDSSGKRIRKIKGLN